jgi:hypothetical protein
MAHLLSLPLTIQLEEPTYPRFNQVAKQDNLLRARDEQHMRTRDLNNDSFVNCTTFASNLARVMCTEFGFIPADLATEKHLYGEVSDEAAKARKQVWCLVSI